MSHADEPSEDLNLGDRVWAPWENSNLYIGTVDRFRDKKMKPAQPGRENEVRVRFDDGRLGWVLPDQIYLLDLAAGVELTAGKPFGKKHEPVRVAEAEGYRVRVLFENGASRWMETKTLALPCEPDGPDARVSKEFLREFTAINWTWTIFLVVIIFLSAMLKALLR